MGRPHSLGSCHFRDVLATCLPHKGEASRLVTCPRTQQANLRACSLQHPLNAKRQAGKLWTPFFKVFWHDSTRRLSPRSTDCEADALTTPPFALVCKKMMRYKMTHHINRPTYIKGSQLRMHTQFA